MAENDEVVPNTGAPARKPLPLKLKPLKPIETPAAAPAENAAAPEAVSTEPQGVQQPKPMTPPAPIRLKPVQVSQPAVPAVEEKKEVAASDPTIKAQTASVGDAETVKVSEPAVQEAAAPKAPVQSEVLEDTRKTIEAPAEKSKIGVLKPGERSAEKDESKPAEQAPAEKAAAPVNKKPAPVKKPRPVYDDEDVSPVFLVSSVIALILALGLAAISFIQYSNLFNGTNIQIPGL